MLISDSVAFSFYMINFQEDTKLKSVLEFCIFFSSFQKFASQTEGKISLNVIKTKKPTHINRLSRLKLPQIYTALKKNEYLLACRYEYTNTNSSPNTSLHLASFYLLTLLNTFLLSFFIVTNPPVVSDRVGT